MSSNLLLIKLPTLKPIPYQNCFARTCFWSRLLRSRRLLPSRMLLIKTPLCRPSVLCCSHLLSLYAYTSLQVFSKFWVRVQKLSRCPRSYFPQVILLMLASPEQRHFQLHLRSSCTRLSVSWIKILYLSMSLLNPDSLDEAPEDDPLNPRSSCASLQFSLKKTLFVISESPEPEDLD